MDSIRQLHIEISSLCNAACPACPRFFNNSKNVNPMLEQKFMSIDTFKSYISPEILGKTESLLFCGNHGDPVTNPHLLEIVEYCHLHLKGDLSIHTNGGMQSPTKWSKIGSIFAKNLDRKWRVVFSIDGLEDTNHIYRRNVKWDKLKNNFLAFIEAGGFSTWEYLVFRHNEHQLEEARNRAIEYGFGELKIKNALNLDNGTSFNTIPAMNSDGTLDYQIYPPENELYRTSIPKDDKVHEIIKTFDRAELDRFLNSDNSSYNKVEFDHPIKPKCEDELYVDASGTVFPCCFTAISYPFKKFVDGKYHYTNKSSKQLHEAYMNIGIDKLNLDTNKLENILENRILDKIYKDKWDKSVEEGKLLSCITFCGEENSLSCLYNKEIKTNSI